MKAPELAASERLRQEIRFCTAADGTRIAYATMGHGPPLVRAPNWLTHLEHESETLLWRHWLEEFPRDYQFIRFDQRGCGLSDRDVEDISLDAWVSDLEAAVDAAGIERFALLGLSQGGAVAIEYAARHPERVTRLVLYGTFVQAKGQSQAETEALITLTRENWGQDSSTSRQLFTSILMPGASEAEVDAFYEWQRVSTTGEIAGRVMSAVVGFDVTGRLPEVSAPTLVLHRVDDAVPFSNARTIAALIPNARLVALEGRSHWLLARHPAWQTLVSEVRAFLASGPVAEEAEVPQPAAAGSNSGLSLREIEVLRLIAAGRSNPQIADELVISINTVQRHVSNIFAKIGAANRTEAAGYATRNGLA